MLLLLVTRMCPWACGIFHMQSPQSKHEYTVYAHVPLLGIILPYLAHTNDFGIII